MTDSRTSPGAGPSVCPFVALAEDRDRRADTPDDGNRCYAERAPRRRDLVYQSDYCYSPEFAQCSVFLSWAARNAAEPSLVSEAAQRAWGSGISALQGPASEASGSGAASEPDDGGTDGEPAAAPTPEGGLFGLAESAEPDEVQTTEQLDWVSASAWAEAPWDERAEQEAEELQEIEEEELEAEGFEEEEAPQESAEATRAPKVPAALPLRKRKPPQEPIRSRGSGEWFYADAPQRDPLVSRRYGVTPPIMLAVLGILLVSIVVFLVATQLGGGDSEPAAAASPSPAISLVPRVTAAPAVTAEPSQEPESTPSPKPRYYRVKAGDSLTSIARKFDVKPNHIVCLNRMKNRDVVVLGVRYEIPPEGFKCPPGWRNATPEP